MFNNATGNIQLKFVAKILKVYKVIVMDSQSHP